MRKWPLPFVRQPDDLERKYPQTNMYPGMAAEEECGGPACAPEEWAISNRGTALPLPKPGEEVCYPVAPRPFPDTPPAYIGI